jgi:hypothetical protein
MVHMQSFYSYCAGIFVCRAQPLVQAAPPRGDWWRSELDPQVGNLREYCVLTRSAQVTPGVTSGEAGGGVPPLQQM